MKKAEAVLRDVLKKTTPTNKEIEDTKRALDRIVKATGRVVKTQGLSYTIAGSYLRDTWLADKKEFDIFILFSPTVPRERLEKKGIDIGKRIVAELKGEHEIAYAEHPYIRAAFGEYAVDFVPCYDIKDPGRIKSAVDRTPHHNRYLKKNLAAVMSPEVRMLKQFCKGLRIYGSDLRAEGFSGYLLELLTIRYKTFKNLLMEARNWEAGKVFIDLEGRYEDEGPGPKDKFPSQPLIFIDPVDKNRNVAAALSPANFELFKQSCKSFLQSPSEKYFVPKKTGLGAEALMKILKKRSSKLISVSFSRPGVVDDVLFPQLRRSSKRLVGMLEDSDFRVLGHDAWSDKEECILFFELEVWSLPATKIITGPPVFSSVHSRQFIRKYEGKERLWVEGANWVTEGRRKFTEAGEFIGKILKSDAKTLAKKGIASYVADSLCKGSSVMEDGRVILKAKSNKGFALFLTEYFKKKIV